VITIHDVRHAFGDHEMEVAEHTPDEMRRLLILSSRASVGDCRWAVHGDGIVWMGRTEQDAVDAAFREAPRPPTRPRNCPDGRECDPRPRYDSCDSGLCTRRIVRQPTDTERALVLMFECPACCAFVGEPCRGAGAPCQSRLALVPPSPRKDGR
jgi:hypothetical protein